MQDATRQAGGLGRGVAPWVAAVLASALFALPLVLLVRCRADYVVFANESLAYRYFACERLQHGERGTVWLPQGQLLGVVQHGILFAIEHVFPWSRDDLRHRANAFGLGTTLANVLVMVAIFFAVARARALSWSDKLLVFLVGLVPLYATGPAGVYYSVLPDYYHTDIVLVTLAAAVFIAQLRAGPSPRPLVRAALVGALAGLLVANKITLAVAGGMAVAPALCAGGPGLREGIRRLLAAAASAAAAFLLVMLAFYLFRPSAVVEVLPRWAGFAQTATGEANFWRLGFWFFVHQYQYGYVIAFWLATAGVAVVMAWRGNTGRAVVGLALLNVLAGLACAGFLYKRPAGTTFFEVAVLLTGLAGMALALVGRERLRHGLVLAAVVAWVLLSAVTFPGNPTLPSLRDSARAGDRFWAIHREILRLAAGRKIVVVLPDNSYGYCGVQEFLLKGASDFPTWDISARGQSIIDRFAPHMVFRHDGGRTPPGAGFPGDSLVVWFDRPGLPAVAARYPSLAEALHTAGAAAWAWDVADVHGRPFVRARACLVPARPSGGAGH